MDVDQVLSEFTTSYLEILDTELKGLNLTRITDEDEFFSKQVVDSVLPFAKAISFCDRFLEESPLFVDVGFGGGFPLLPLSLIYQDFSFIGLEARAKKARAVQLIADKMGIENVKTFHQRLEGLIIDFPCFFTFKAVGPYRDLLARINHLKSVPCYALMYKGSQFEEIEGLRPVPKGWELVADEVISIPTGEERRALLFKNVPRRTFPYDKNLVTLSSLL